MGHCPCGFLLRFHCSRVDDREGRRAFEWRVRGKEEMGGGFVVAGLGEGFGWGVGGVRMSSFHPAGWPAPVLLKPEERQQTPQQMKHTAPPHPQGPLPEHGPTDRKTVNEFRWLN